VSGDATFLCCHTLHTGNIKRVLLREKSPSTKHLLLLWCLWYFHKYFNIMVNVPLRAVHFKGLLIEYFAFSKQYKNIKIFAVLKWSANHWALERCVK